MKDILSLNGKVIIITGAGKGIGNHVLLELKKKKAVVYGLDIAIPKSKEINYIKCNVTKPRQVEQCCNQIFKKHGRIDGLINNAGITLPSDNDYPLSKWNKTLLVNLSAPFICSKCVAKYMAKAQQGSIINITSINAEVGFPNNPAYVASKGGLKMLTKSIAKDYGRYGIRANNVGFGYIKTDMTKQSYDNLTKRNEIERHTLLGRWGNPSDAIGVIIFLLSDASSYITGQDIYIDGGWLANGLIDFEKRYDIDPEQYGIENYG